MELRYPIVILITTLFIIIFYFLFTKKKDVSFKKGSKIANTEYLKNSDYYKKLIFNYNIIKITITTLFIISFVSMIILLSRLTKVDSNNINQYNRDIFLCMDVSASVDDLNMELVDNLKDTVSKLNGERFGISIFNTSSVILVPLTDDYDYINDVLDTIKDSIKSNNTYVSSDDYYFYIRNYIYSGTLEDNQSRGSSLIGDGLASCVYGFSNLDEERTRIIIFSTDNDLAGTPLVSLTDAAKISKSKNIKVFGIGTKYMKENNRLEFKNAVNITNGKFYEHSNTTVNNIVKDIDSTSKTLLDKKVETKKTDIPFIPFIVLIFSLTGIIILRKKVIQ